MAFDFIVFPKTERKAAEAIIEFIEFRNCRIPQVVGAIDSPDTSNISWQR